MEGLHSTTRSKHIGPARWETDTMTRKERDRANFLARVAEETARQTASDRETARAAKRARWARRGFTPREKVASREEQYARYLDCGPAAWDDR